MIFSASTLLRQFWDICCRYRMENEDLKLNIKALLDSENNILEVKVVVTNNRKIWLCLLLEICRLSDPEKQD